MSAYNYSNYTSSQYSGGAANDLRNRQLQSTDPATGKKDASNKAPQLGEFAAASQIAIIGAYLVQLGQAHNFGLLIGSGARRTSPRSTPNYGRPAGRVTVAKPHEDTDPMTSSKRTVLNKQQFAARLKVLKGDFDVHHTDDGTVTTVYGKGFTEHWHGDNKRRLDAVVYHDGHYPTVSHKDMMGKLESNGVNSTYSAGKMNPRDEDNFDPFFTVTQNGVTSHYERTDDGNFQLLGTTPEGAPDVSGPADDGEIPGTIIA